MKLLALLIVINLLNLCNGHVHYYFDKFVIKGTGCAKNGELLNLGECTTNICGGVGQLITATDYAHGGFKSSMMSDNKCENTTDSIEFKCVPGNEPVSIGDYNLVCYEEGQQVVPNYQSYTLSGPSCDGTEEIPTRGDCVKVCGEYTEVTKRGRAVGTFVLTQYGQDANCSTQTSSSDFICIQDSKVSVEDLSISCEIESSSSASSASSLKVFAYLSIIILSIILLF